MVLLVVGCNWVFSFYVFVKFPSFIENVTFQFNDRHIPDSPHVVKIAPPAADAHKVEIAQFPQGTIQPNTPSQFLVRKNGAKGDIDAKVCQLNNDFEMPI